MCLLYHNILVHYLFVFLMLGRLPKSTLFPYTTLFRSGGEARRARLVAFRVVLRHQHEALGVDRVVVAPVRSEEHTSELQSLRHLVCRLLLEKKNSLIKARISLA